eukprot:gnl/TRDRNA2_/TRDRNA2_153354_c2_seq1.p2 gnl/TRDRNA2_/TRDRNA2_153354_c2~~gnl/TRDRNA2_/TRDRNA2_153354_c2_seq1.p2  ORF type:complete len:163 (+),score=33.04 gnl/TRDRNA2_/TRDRNA2_153354_c2_seq1:438-926(+)
MLLKSLTVENERLKTDVKTAAMHAKTAAKVQENERAKMDANIVANVRKNEPLKMEAKTVAIVQENERLKMDAKSVAHELLTDRSLAHKSEPVKAVKLNHKKERDGSVPKGKTDGRTYKRHTLKNGLKILAVHAPGARSAGYTNCMCRPGLSKNQRIFLCLRN